MAQKIRKAPIDYAAVSEAWLLTGEGARKPTINDVARLAGVSKKTVSRVINDSPLVNPGTREGIKTVMRTIRYQPDPQARGLAFRRSFLIGMIYDNPNPQYIVNMQLGILDSLRGTGFELVVHPCNRKSPNFVDDARSFIELQKLSGVIVTPSVSEDERIAEVLSTAGCGYVRIASVPLGDEKHMIVTNDRQGAREAGRHLAGLGHKHVAFVAGRPDFRSAIERQAGFEEGLADHGVALSRDYILPGNYLFESGLECGEALLKLDPLPTAVFAANDEMAVGVLQALRMAGGDAAERLSVVGYDDFDLASKTWPRLTTVRAPTRRIGQLAAQRVLHFSRAQDGDPIPKHEAIVPTLIERDSTRAPHDD